jgi:hypothetical protein
VIFTGLGPANFFRFFFTFLLTTRTYVWHIESLSSLIPVNCHGVVCAIPRDWSLCVGEDTGREDIGRKASSREHAVWEHAVWESSSRRHAAQQDHSRRGKLRERDIRYSQGRDGDLPPHRRLRRQGQGSGRPTGKLTGSGGPGKPEGQAQEKRSQLNCAPQPKEGGAPPVEPGDVLSDPRAPLYPGAGASFPWSVAGAGAGGGVDREAVQRKEER